MTNSSSWHNGEALLRSIREDSKQRRTTPIEFFKQFLSDIWIDNTQEEAMQQWTVKVQQFPWYADDALYCLEKVIENPPDNLIDLMEEYGWIIMYHEPDELGNETPYTYEEYLEYLKQMRDKFRKIYDSAPSSITEE